MLKNFIEIEKININTSFYSIICTFNDIDVDFLLHMDNINSVSTIVKLYVF